MHFGELSILKASSRTETAISTENSILLALSNSKFMDSLALFPEVAKYLKIEAGTKHAFLLNDKAQV